MEVTDDGTDIWLLPLAGPREPRRFRETPFGEWDPQFSRDGRWLAYQSNMSGSFEIYIAPLSGGGQTQVSKGGGEGALWSSDGRELFYRSRNSMMAVSIDTSGPEPRIGAPRVLFSLQPFQGDGDVAPDGRFLFVKRTPQESPSRVIQLVFNWLDDLQATVPSR